MPGLDPELIKHALTVARQHGFAEVEIEAYGAKFSASLEKAKRQPKPAPAAAPADDHKSNGFLDIKATLVGYYKQADSALAAGKNVSKGDVVAVITALGLDNEVESQHSGEVTDVLVRDGEPVQFGQVLARVKGKA